MVSTPQARANRFMDGLAQEIQLSMTSTRLTCYADVLSAAQRFERVAERGRRIQSAGSKRPFAAVSGGRQNLVNLFSFLF